MSTKNERTLNTKLVVTGGNLVTGGSLTVVTAAVRLVVTGGSLTRRPKWSLRCLLIEVL